ncbi:MAG: McrB family protein [Isosphaeraceae bacterium]
MSDIGNEHVELAMAEAEELGRGSFLAKYGFGHATTYLVRHDGRFFDPKALVGVAHGFTESGRPLTVNDFDATEGIARLRTLGFEIVPFKGLWWVNQGATYKHEQEGGYVWAPKLTKAGRPAAHHVAVSQLRPGQQIVHYASGAIRAIGYVAADPESVRKPDELTGDAWDVDGYGCRVAYRELQQPIPRNQVPNRTAAVGPFDVNGDLKQGYLFRVADDELFPLLEFLNLQVPDLFVEPALAADDPFEGLPPEQSPTDPIHDLLVLARNVVLEGVPGTGKSFAIERLSAEWQRRTGRALVSFAGKPFAAQVMHPSSSYEDFMEGLRPASGPLSPDQAKMFDEPVSGGGEFVVDDGFFLGVCAQAVRHPDKDVLVLIDELNRCNVSSVLGDLLLTLEASRRAKFAGESDQLPASAGDWMVSVPVRLPYSGRTFFVPDNVYVVATTNTTDRSVAPLDAAIRRRFAFYRIEPDVAGAVDLANQVLPADRARRLEQSASMLRVLNEDALAPCLGPDAMLGPSYLYSLVDSLRVAGGLNGASTVWRYSVVPQLIDVTRSYGAEDLLSFSTRNDWFADHGAELIEVADGAREALGRLDTFLASLGFRIVVDGTGLARGARVIDATRGRVDISHEPVELANEHLEIATE